MAESDATVAFALLHKRPLPSFEQWLEANGDGTRGDGFEALAALARRAHAAEPPAHLTPDELSFLRMWMGMQIAVIELCNIEAQKGREPHQVIQTFPRVLGAAAFYAVASVMRDDANVRAMARVLLEEFRHGVNTCADQFGEARARAEASA